MVLTQTTLFSSPCIRAQVLRSLGWRKVEERPAINMGVAFHACVEEHSKDPAGLLPANDRMMVEAMYLAYCNIYGYEQCKHEVRFTLSLFDDVALQGVCDILTDDAVVDLKTISAHRVPKDPDAWAGLNWQLAVYSLASYLIEHKERKRVVRFIVKPRIRISDDLTSLANRVEIIEGIAPALTTDVREGSDLFRAIQSRAVNLRSNLNHIHDYNHGIECLDEERSACFEPFPCDFVDICAGKCKLELPHYQQIINPELKRSFKHIMGEQKDAQVF